MEAKKEAIEEAVKALGKVLVCSHCIYFKIPNWARKFKNVVEQCTLGLEPKEGGECRLFKPRER
jgi:hypothetical protein